MKPWDKEAIYDEKISPLMSQIIELCKEHGVPLIAQFQYANTEENGPAYVTTCLPLEGIASDHIREMSRRVQPRRDFAIAETIVTNPDGSKHITSRLIR